MKRVLRSEGDAELSQSVLDNLRRAARIRNQNARLEAEAEAEERNRFNQAFAMEDYAFPTMPMEDLMPEPARPRLMLRVRQPTITTPTFRDDIVENAIVETNQTDERTLTLGQLLDKYETDILFMSDSVFGVFSVDSVNPDYTVGNVVPSWIREGEDGKKETIGYKVKYFSDNVHAHNYQSFVTRLGVNYTDRYNYI